MGKSVTSKGLSAIKNKSTWKTVAGIAGGTLAASVSVVLSNKLIGLVSENTSLHFATGTLSAGAVTMLSFGKGWENVGAGAAAVAATQAANTVITLVSGKSLAQLTA